MKVRKTQQPQQMRRRVTTTTAQRRSKTHVRKKRTDKMMHVIPYTAHLPAYHQSSELQQTICFIDN